MANNVKAPVTRARSTKERSNPALVQDIIKDILQNEGFIQLVEESIKKRMNEMETSIDKMKADIFDLQTSNDNKSKKITILKDKESALIKITLLE